MNNNTIFVDEENMNNNTVFVDYDISRFTKKPLFNLSGKVFPVELEGEPQVALYNEDWTTLTFQVKKTPNQFQKYNVRLEVKKGKLYVSWEKSVDLIKSIREGITRIMNGHDNSQR